MFFIWSSLHKVILIPQEITSSTINFSIPRLFTFHGGIRYWHFQQYQQVPIFPIFHILHCSSYQQLISLSVNYDFEEPEFDSITTEAKVRWSFWVFITIIIIIIVISTFNLTGKHIQHRHHNDDHHHHHDHHHDHHDGRLGEDREGLTNAKPSTLRERTPVLQPPSTSCVSHRLIVFFLQHIYTVF